MRTSVMVLKIGAPTLAIKDFVLSSYYESDGLVIPQHESIEFCPCYSFPSDLQVVCNTEQLFFHGLWSRKNTYNFLHHLRGERYLSPAWKCDSHVKQRLCTRLDPQGSSPPFGGLPSRAPQSCLYQGGFWVHEAS